MGSDAQPLNGAAYVSVDELRDRARAAYTTAIDGVATRMLDEFLLADDQVSILYDMAQFTTFLCAAKIVGVKGQPATRENLMAAYWPMQKALKDEVPGMLRNLAEAIEQGADADVD